MNKKQFNTGRYTSTCRNEIEFGKIRVEKALKLVGKGKKVLDIGCGDGYISEKIKKMGNDVVGIEISKEAARLCKKKGIKCIEQDIEKRFPFPNNSFDVVFGGEIIEHVFDTDALLQEIKRVLKPNCHLVLTTPNIAALTRRIKLLFGKNPIIDVGLIDSPGHIRYFTSESFRRLLERNGYNVKTLRADFISIRNLKLVKLGNVFPNLGVTLIVKARLKNSQKRRPHPKDGEDCFPHFPLNIFKHLNQF